MKSQIVLFFVVLFFAASIAAQPGPYSGFKLNDLCRYKENKMVFVGRVVSTKQLFSQSSPKTLLSTTAFVVSVEKVFSGQLELHEIEEISNSYHKDTLEVNSEHIFIVEEISRDGSKFLLTEDWSVPLSQYNADEKAVIFSRIEARISRFPKSPPLTGIVLQTDASPEKPSLELYLTFGYEAKIYKSVTGITVIAKSKKTGQAYKTETNEKGVFTFNNLEDGDYDLSMVIPKGFEEKFRYNGIKSNNIVSVKKENCGDSGAIFKIRKIKKPSL